MKWKVEYITESSSNILVDAPYRDDMDLEPVGVGFPLGLAERIVKLHNEAIDIQIEKYGKFIKECE